MSAPALLRALKQHFGYDSFRPLQEEIIRDALAGSDVFALLPTGGGKSLCFQLPALLRDGLTIVVSPLIALMKDQVDALTASGVAATFLNSTLDAASSRSRHAGLYQGKYRLLYVAPERLMLGGFLEQIKSWNVAQIAIDEAHCISEWGHDFRPEYRQLAGLRDHLPGIPVMALTATATERVREDIVHHLRLAEPRCYVASFNRPNLSYRVLQKERPFEQTLAFAKNRKSESGIIYCSSRKAAEMVAERLTAQGIRALPYHAGLDAAVRSRNQELFIRDDVRVVCATIAFGMGINKPNVRYVLHYDLPKNIEGYYQETGRAGRDGLPSECLLLFSAGDVVKQTAFIDEKPDPMEQERARALLQQMVHYAESSGCRRATLLGYFGEEFGEPNCGACDNCLTPRETFDGTVAAQKFLSCIIRLRQASRSGSASFGLNHLTDVLCGADNDRIRKWDHQQVSTYGIGKEHGRSAWQQIGRELIRLGYCRQTTDKFPTIELTADGLRALKERTPVQLARPVSKPDVPARDRGNRRGDIACDETLFARLRGVRKQLADARDVPAYVVFSDVSLRLMAREYPTNERELARISGVGEKKLREFGAPFMDAIREHLELNPRQHFEGLAQTMYETPPSYSAPRKATFEAGPRKQPIDSARESMRLFRAGMTLEEVARQREISTGTVTQHLVLCVEQGDPFDLASILTAKQQATLSGAFSKCGFERLVPVMDMVGPGFRWEQLHLFRAVQRASAPA